MRRPGHGSRLAAIGDGLADGVEEALDARPVPPVPRELARAGALRAPQLRIARRARASARAAASTSPAGTSAPFSPSRRRSCAAPTRSERTSGSPHAAASFTTTAHVSRSERSAKTSAATYSSTIRSQSTSSDEHQPDAELARELLEARPLRAVAREDEHEVRLVRGRDGAHEHVEPLLRRQARDAEDDDVVSAARRARDAASGRRPASPSARLPKSSTSTVFAKRCTRSGRAPRASIESRASVPVTRIPAARWTSGGTTVPLTARRHRRAAPRRGSRRRAGTGRP